MTKNKTSTLKTTERILTYLRKLNKPITPTNLSKSTGISYNSILASISSLEKWDQINTITDGRIVLVSCKVKDEVNNWGHTDQNK